MLCVYCGMDAGSTKDHVPPKSLLRKPYPANLWTVPSCAACNSAFSKDEEYFRLIMVGLLCHTPEAEQLFDGPICRSMDRNLGLEDRMFGSVAESGGRPFLDADYRRIFRVAEKIARGLRYVATATLYPRDEEFDVGFFEVDSSSEVGTFGPDFTFRMMTRDGSSWEFTLFESLRFTVQPA